MRRSAMAHVRIDWRRRPDIRPASASKAMCPEIAWIAVRIRPQRTRQALLPGRWGRPRPLPILRIPELAIPIELEHAVPHPLQQRVGGTAETPRRLLVRH